MDYIQLVISLGAIGCAALTVALTVIVFIKFFVKMLANVKVADSVDDCYEDGNEFVIGLDITRVTTKKNMHFDSTMRAEI